MIKSSLFMEESNLKQLNFYSEIMNALGLSWGRNDKETHRVL